MKKFFIILLFASSYISSSHFVFAADDTTPPKATSITYFDDNHNGKIDRFLLTTDEPILGPIATPYSTGIAINTRNNGLVQTCDYCDISEFVSGVDIVDSSVTFYLAERDNIKPHLAINANPGSSASDLKIRIYTNAGLHDAAGNLLVLTTSSFPNSSTGIIDSTTGIDFLDTGWLNGANFGGALSVPKIDSRGILGSLTLNNIILTLSSPSFLGDSNTLQIGAGSRIDGNTTLTLGAESQILGSSSEVLFAKSGFSSSFRTMSGEVLSDVSTVTESGIYYVYNGTLIGSGLTLSVDYVVGDSAESLFSGALSTSSTLIGLPHELSGGNLRATVSRSFGAGESASFSGVTLLFDTLTQSSVTFAASIVSTGSVVDITRDGASLSGVIFRPNTSGNIYYGTGELTQTGTVTGGVFTFTGLVAGTLYNYRLGLVPFPDWEEILSDTSSFTTLPALIPPPTASIAFQSTTYLLDQNPLLNEFTCDNTHTDCKINFNLESSFGTGYTASDYFCELDFDLDYENGEEYKCNPNTVTFPRGHDYTLRFRIIHTLDVDLASERTIIIHAPLLTDIPVVISPPSSGGGSSLPSPDPVIVPDPILEVSTISSVSIADPIIVIQSGIDSANHCKNTADCTVNLEYKVLGPKEACHWDFSGGSYLSGTENKCNPGYVHYPIGNFTITLRVYEQGNITNFREKTLSFTSGTITEIAAEKITPTSYPPVAAIKLQGSLGKTKKQSGNSVICVGVDECSINLSGEESYDLNRDKLTYYWDFGNGETSDRENPLAVKFTTGEYRITFRVTDPTGLSSEVHFMVTVTGKDKKEIPPKKPIDPNVFSLRITGVSPNPLGNDGVSEWAEITNPLGVDVSLASCTLDDDLEKGSHSYSFQDTAMIPANSKKRYYKLQTLLNFNNTGDSANLMCDDRLVSSISWDYSVPEGFIVSGKKGPYSENVRVKVLRVVDGDTIVVELYGKQEKVRLIGVDTPETLDPRKSVQYFGVEASNYTKKMLEGKEVELEFDYNPRDKYDRLLAYVWLDGASYNEQLIRLGYGRAYLRFPFRYFKTFEKIGKEAEKNKVGLWADPEVKKLLLEETKEDKKELEKQLKEEDVAILDDLIEVAEDPEIAADKLDAEFLDRLLDVEDDDPVSKKKYTSLRKVLEKVLLQSIEIQLQGLTSSKNRHLAGNIFTCRTKKTCSVNFTAGKARKDTIYFWDFGNGETFYGANPKSLKFGIGMYQVSLRVLDAITGEFHDSFFTVTIQKLITVKKPKKPKVAKVKVEKPLSVRLNDFFIGSSVFPPSLSPEDTAGASTALAFVFFSGVHIILRKRKIVL